MDTIENAAIGVLTAIAGVGLKFIEVAIVAPAELNSNPYFVLSIQYELTLTALGILYGAFPYAGPSDTGPFFRALTLVGLGLFFTYISIAISVRKWGFAERNEEF